MKFNTIDDLKAAGFEGFIPVVQLQADSTAIPRTAGVYIWLSIQREICPSFSPTVREDSLRGKIPMCR